jgi:hypothetical protein
LVGWRWLVPGKQVIDNRLRRVVLTGPFSALGFASASPRMVEPGAFRSLGATLRNSHATHCTVSERFP